MQQLVRSITSNRKADIDAKVTKVRHIKILTEMLLKQFASGFVSSDGHIINVCTNKFVTFRGYADSVVRKKALPLYLLKNLI